MRSVVQRVSAASVEVQGEEIASIGAGLLVYLGIEDGDDEKDLTYMADKVVNLRIFEDREGAMNLSLLDRGGEALVISQFTLLGDCRKGRRPSFTGAMEPEKAKVMIERFVKEMAKRSVSVKQGKFRAFMQIKSLNNGPVTILIDSKKNF